MNTEDEYNGFLELNECVACEEPFSEDEGDVDLRLCGDCAVQVYRMYD